MRTEIKKMIPMMFREEHFEYELSTVDFQECKLQVESILCHFEVLVDEAVCHGDGTSEEDDTGLAELVPKLMALRPQILNDASHPNNASSGDHIQKIAKVVSFGRVPAQFGSSRSMAHNFNQAMNNIFAEKGKAGNDLTSGIFQGDSVFDAKPVYQAEKLVKASKELYRFLKDNTCSSTKKPHSAHIHLTGFDRPEFDMILDDKCLTQAGSHSQRAVRWIEKIRLETLIANSLLFLHGSPFIQAAWNTDTINILQDQSINSDGQAPFPDPYITCAFDPGRPEQYLREKELDGGDPFLLDLTTLLLELETDQKVTLEPDDVDEFTGEPSLFMALGRIHQGLKGESGDDSIYRDVIDACLNMYSEFTDLENQDEYHRFRTQFLRKVVKPLKDRYEVLKDPGAFAKRAIRANSNYAMPPQQKLPILQMIPLRQSVGSENSIKEPILEVAEVEPPPRDYGGIESSPTVDEDPSFLASTGKISSSWLWVQRIDAINTIHLKDIVTTRKVKIAILDTGCDLDADCMSIIRNAEARLEDHWYDGVPGGSPSPVDDDTSKVKHGTALVSLLLRIAPYAEVFVARVAKAATELDSAKESVAKAIIYAAETWDVDIISMSFGFPRRPKEVNEAIRKARRIKEDREKEILFFAAARNDGSNAREMFPASHLAVISVRGTDHTGNFVSDYNPDVWPDKKGTMLFGTLGKDVPYDLGDPKAKLSGCSLATPVLVGITAMIIHYVSCVSSGAIELNALLSREGVLQVLQEISIEKDGGRRYVAPWEFFFEKEEQVRIASIQAALGKLQRQSDN
ncbi:hypothetical protein EG329_002013 [Mollisiaceae sp. DMI_Dod_QoI]|nr:hypothetical protein EG329_002013 [Helotiales sp. DMI_Dod_QoI]